MKILIINGSPKGPYSITLHTCLYIQKLFPGHTYEILHAGQKIRTYEKDMSEAITALEAADLILFSYPVYTFLAPAQLHRFIRLIKESGCDLSGKFATQITTSKHFFDVTAHRFIRDNCADLGLRYIKGLSADMEDLTKKQGQEDARKFWEYVQFCVEHDICEAPSAPISIPVPTDKPDPTSEAPSNIGSLSDLTSDPPATRTEKETKNIVIVASYQENDTAIRSMIKDFQAVCPHHTRVVRLEDFPFQGGCISCFHCAADGTCIYKDGFDRFLREEIQTADAIIYAFTIQDHSMGPRFKLYDDRQFCNGHRTVTMGMPMGYLIAGNLASEENLRTVIEARCEVGHNFLCGIANDAAGIQTMNARLIYALEHAYVQPQNFYGVGGMKIFRDLIYIMRGLMRADHKFYRQHGIYDFPQKKRGQMLLMIAVGALMNNPKLRARAGKQISEGMIAPYKKVLEQTDVQISES
ncbi:MAG: NAD(P)H-dependent oxidoreductase [Lachnospiraceae bacterium]|nr:NAD(P)H-dependent oxidoreductase [Lachnospiraceae bacterium]